MHWQLLTPRNIRGTIRSEYRARKKRLIWYIAMKCLGKKLVIEPLDRWYIPSGRLGSAEWEAKRREQKRILSGYVTIVGQEEIPFGEWKRKGDVLIRERGIGNRIRRMEAEWRWPKQ